MFVRTKRSARNGRTYEYLQIVRSYREAGRVRQQVVATLGRRDHLLATGELDGLLKSLGRFSENVRVVDYAESQDMRARSARLWGAPLVFGRLWEEQGVPRILRRLATGRRFRFDVERACFGLALQRLCRPGSDLQGSRWFPTVEAPGLDRLELQHLYRTCAFLYDVREQLEEALFFEDRDLFSQSLDVVFLDTTSTYIYRDTETPFRRRGYSRDRRGDLPQFVLCVVVDRAGWPIAWEVFPGNTADVVAFRHVISALRERFRIGRVIVVADRGMISRNTIQLLTGHDDAPFDYVLGCRMRRSRDVRDVVLLDNGPFETINETLAVKEVRVEGRRYVVCRNETEARKDAESRSRIVAKLEEHILKHGPKSVVKNRGFARFLRVDRGSVHIDEEAVERDARFDGTFVLTTNTKLPPAEVATTYKSLWRVERTFREEKSTLQVRPIYHHRDDTSIGHIVGSFLALRLEVDLQRRLDRIGDHVPWPDLMHDLDQVRAVHLELDGRRYRLRTDLVGHSHAAFKAAGVRPPPLVQALGPATTPEPPGASEV